MRRTLKFKATLLGLIITVLVVGAAALEIWLDYRDTEQHSYATAADITRVVERQTRDTIFYVDQTLDAVSTLLRDAGGTAGVREAAGWNILQSYCTTLIGCKVIMAIEPDGQVVVGTRDGQRHIDNVSDRTYFERARATHARYIDTAVVSRLPGFPILFNVSKPVYDAQGKLLAVIAIGMETSQLTSFYSLFGFSVAPAVAIYKGNGGLVARNPGMARYVGRSNAKSRIFTTLLPRAPSGIYDSLSPIDGKQRLAAYRSLPELDLVVFAGIERPAAFASWKARNVRLSTIVAVMLALIWGALLVAYRAIAAQSVLREQNLHLDDLASRDALTGIGNRRLFDRLLKHDWSKHCRSGAPLSIVLIDVDCFKHFNDFYGHQAGDLCLQQIAQVIRESLLRESDLAARYGGEEFVALLDCGHEGALLMAEKIRRRIEGLNIPHARSEANAVVTASFGVASTETTHFQHAAELLAQADKALYAAKAGGRNRVMAAESIMHADATQPHT